nr:hypothetical protein CFP56_33569 [Quercus suber]
MSTSLPDVFSWSRTHIRLCRRLSGSQIADVTKVGRVSFLSATISPSSLPLPFPPAQHMATPLRAPEALLGRNDSKNPSTTCMGITSSGRPCRRALAASKASVIQPQINKDTRVALDVQDVFDLMNYCWQHKAQAEQHVLEEPQRRDARNSPMLHPLQERGSIETLVHRLGIRSGSVQNQTGQSRRRNKVEQRGVGRREEGTEKEHTREYAVVPRRTATQDHVLQRPNTSRRLDARRRLAPKSRGFWATLCCVRDDEEYVEIVRHRKRPSKAPAMAMTPASPAVSKVSVPSFPAKHSSTMTTWINGAVTRPINTEHHLDTDRLLSLIPTNLSPQTTSNLLIELSKPISPKDEKGYIYIFWLTPQSKQAPTHEAAQSLLNPERPRPAHRVSDVLTEYSFTGSEVAVRGKQTIMLKIGRANNVTRRMTEWRRQCGYALNLVRWYPCTSANTPTSPMTEQSRNLDPSHFTPQRQQQHEHHTISGNGQMVHKVTFVKRVERLIHLELADRQVKRKCDVCGREHREWFEVEASHAGVRVVDECVKRWVGWAEERARLVSGL